MKHKYKKLCTTILLFTALSNAKAEENKEDVYRLYNEKTGEHFYTASKKETRDLMINHWNFEGSEWNSPSTSKEEVLRLYNPNTGEHFYTKSKKEEKELNVAGWKSEGISFYNSDHKEIPVYRLYNKNAKENTHHYTTNKKEQEMLIEKGWIDEGISWYGTKVTDHTNKDELNKELKRTPEPQKTYLKKAKAEAEIIKESKNTSQKEVDNATNHLKDANHQNNKENYLDLVNRQLFIQINEYRRSQNLPEFVYDASIDDHTQLRANETTEYLDHTRPNGKPFYTALPKNKRMSNEMIVGLYYFESDLSNDLAKESAKDGLDRLIDSPGHHKILTEPHKTNKPWINIKSSYKDNNVIYTVIITEYNS